ncbi:MAG: nicotinate phosphoribosyltransferase, partial [Nitrosopumilaceae archaeon]|nr:nicotinate phosphoribosyltransferase [Nitrosopumilaceae archaeon]NIU89035.1 nicotinate phosphoribosyltransferase [Nitrosopumilaceae archaeon]NIV67140.1 nicotinate phosphoribosyltransferase [Nitrosopumilaceae archaeon]NIX63171.1 nicotinate phosphoribosyltransferase [Nitrosopumilaceae archaeon]
MNNINAKSIILNVDSYKMSHVWQYPPNTEYVFSYVESRGGKYDETVMFGLQSYLKEYLSEPVTIDDVETAKQFIEGHGEPFNYGGWLRLIEKHEGYLPVEIKAVPEGTPVKVGNILVSVVNTDPEFFWLTSYIETSLLRAV